MFNTLNYLIYSTHKTSTQTIVNTLNANNFSSRHLHSLPNLGLTPKSFLKHLNTYKLVNGKRLKIITVIRNPDDRAISSFFQSFHTDTRLGNRSIVSLKNVNELLTMYKNLVLNKTLPEFTESIYQMSKIFGVDILSDLTDNYFENELIELYVLDFNRMDNIDYFNKCLWLELPSFKMCNLSKDTTYYTKYLALKELVKDSPEIHKSIKSNYRDIDIPFFYK